MQFRITNGIHIQDYRNYAFGNFVEWILFLCRPIINTYLTMDRGIKQVGGSKEFEGYFRNLLGQGEKRLQSGFSSFAASYDQQGTHVTCRGK